MVTERNTPANRNTEPKVEPVNHQEDEATLLAHLATGDEATFVGLGNMVVAGLVWQTGQRAAKGNKVDDTSGTADNSTLGERLAALGFVPGAKIAVEANSGRGPVIVNVRGARVAIGRGQAHKMLVRRRRVAR